MSECKCIYCGNDLLNTNLKSLGGDNSICVDCNKKIKIIKKQNAKINFNKKMMKYKKLGYQFAIDYFINKDLDRHL